jgi:hypothetical protein
MLKALQDLCHSSPRPELRETPYVRFDGATVKSSRLLKFLSSRRSSLKCLDSPAQWKEEDTSKALRCHRMNCHETRGPRCICRAVQIKHRIARNTFSDPIYGQTLRVAGNWHTSYRVSARAELKIKDDTGEKSFARIKSGTECRSSHNVQARDIW